MKSQRLLLILTTVNLAILVFQLTWKRTVEASDVQPILRGHALELVDDKGRVRAEIKVLAPGPARKADGSPSEANGEIYPETVQFRLFSSSGGPNVKLAATEDGSGLLLSGAPGYVQILSRPASKAFPEKGPFVKLATESGRKHLIAP
jgi:hypothetical protein